MALSNAALRYYDNNVLRLPADKRKEYHEQVDRLITELCKSPHNRTEVKITKVVKAGSFAKYTILRKTSVDPVDVDVVVYIADKDADQETLQSLNDTIYDLLIKRYPTKSVEDFEIQRKAATVTFAGTGLSVDIVPVIEDPDWPGYGWQFDLQTGDPVETCAPGQIKFVRDREGLDGDFRTLVRMAKKWRNHHGITRLKSFTIELIMAHVLDTQGNGGGIDQRFRNFLLYIAQSGLQNDISFPENSLPLGEFDDPVVIFDPVSSQNNAASRLSEQERRDIVTAANEAWEVESGGGARILLGGRVSTPLLSEPGVRVSRTGLSSGIRRLLAPVIGPNSPLIKSRYQAEPLPRAFVLIRIPPHLRPLSSTGITRRRQYFIHRRVPNIFAPLQSHS